MSIQDLIKNKHNSEEESSLDCLLMKQIPIFNYLNSKVVKNQESQITSRSFKLSTDSQKAFDIRNRRILAYCAKLQNLTFEI